MKKIIILTLLMFVCVSTAFAQTQIKPRVNVNGKKLNYLSDSLVIVYSPDSVKLCSSKSDPQTVTIYGSESDKSFKYSRKDKYNPGETKIVINDNGRKEVNLNSDSPRFDFSVPFYHKIKYRSKGRGGYLLEPGNFGIALLSTKSDELNFKDQRSYEVFLNMYDDVRLCRGVAFNYGVGLNWKNFAMTKNGMMTKDDEGNVYFGEWPGKCDPKVSKLRVFSVTFPFILSFNIFSGCGFTMGPVVNLNTYSSIVNKYKLDGEKQKDKYKNAHCNLATVDLMFQLKIRDIGAYVKYSPMNIMDTDEWPDFQHWAIGMTLSL